MTLSDSATPPPSSWRSSRVAGFYRLSVDERLNLLHERGFLDDDGMALLRRSGSALSRSTAEAMIENVVGVFELPIGVGLNFLINGKDYAIPMVVEEPSIVAAVSHAANLVRRCGGFTAQADRSVMTGQIQVVGVADPHRAAEAVVAAKEDLLALANQLEPNMVARGGGAVDLDVRVLTPEGTKSRHQQMVIVHIYVDTCDAMGANLINTIAEGLAGEIEAVTGGAVYLRILSNLTDRRRVSVQCSLPVEELGWQGYTGEEVAEGIVNASVFAETDPYRAATHNKGIMNGIDAVALATGQDWRALEAGAHAFAAVEGRYRPLARWSMADPHTLVGELDLPLAVGIVGGPIRLHPTVRVLLDMLGVESARELACVMGSVGLAQNLGAIKALGSTGIQRGHMALHARSVAATAGACGPEVEVIAQAMIGERTIKVERAATLLRELRQTGGP